MRIAIAALLLASPVLSVELSGPVLPTLPQLPVSAVPIGDAPVDEVGGRWNAFERRLLEAVKLDQEPAGRRWLGEATEILREQPNVPVADALTRSFAKVHSIAPTAVEDVKKFLADGFVDAGVGSEGARWFLKSEGDAYLQTDKDLFRFVKGANGGQWIHQPDMPPGILTLKRFGSEIFLGTSTGLFVRRDGDYDWSRRGPEMPIYALAEKGGVIFAGSDHGIFTVDSGRWRRKKRGWKGVYWLSVEGDRLLAGTRNGLFESSLKIAEAGARGWWTRIMIRLRGRVSFAWRTIFSDTVVKSVSSDYGGSFEASFPATVLDSAVIEGRRHLSTDDGLYRQESDGAAWTKVISGDYIRHTRRIDGRDYALGQNNVYRRDGSSWVKAQASFQDANDLILEGESLYKATKEGLKVFIGLSEDVILSDVSAEIARASQKPAAAASSAGDFKQDEKGAILDENGVTLLK